MGVRPGRPCSFGQTAMIREPLSKIQDMKTIATCTLTILVTALIADASNSQSIVGGWFIDNAGQARSSAVITFLGNGYYFMAEDGDSVADPSGHDGMERGTYSWDSATGAFSAATLVDTSGEWGLSHPSGNTIITVLENTLTANGVLNFSRVANTTKSIVGSWFGQNLGQARSSVVITFLGNGNYFMAEDGDSVADPSGHDGMERGTYSWDSATGAFSATALVDTSGEWGISGFSGIISVSGNTLTVDGQFTFTRVAAPPAITMDRLDPASIRIHYVGILQQTDDFIWWTDVSPQPRSPWIVPLDYSSKFFRARAY